MLRLCFHFAFISFFHFFCFHFIFFIFFCFRFIFSLVCFLFRAVFLFHFQYFPGNTNRNGIVMHRLFPMPRARVLRFRPNRWHRWISMRVEVHGCPAGKCIVVSFKRCSHYIDKMHFKIVSGWFGKSRLPS